MKRFVLTFLLLLALPGVCFAAQSALSGDGYRQALSGYDLSAFEKLGACASYIVRDGEVRTIGADTLPVGVLPEVESRSLRMTMQTGDVVVMMTDGVRDAYPGGEVALREDIGKLAWLHPQSVGEKLIARAVSSGEACDDMAILCARMSRTAIE